MKKKLFSATAKDILKKTFLSVLLPITTALVTTIITFTLIQKPFQIELAQSTQDYAYYTTLFNKRMEYYELVDSKVTDIRLKLDDIIFKLNDNLVAKDRKTNILSDIEEANKEYDKLAHVILSKFNYSPFNAQNPILEFVRQYPKFINRAVDCFKSLDSTDFGKVLEMKNNLTTYYLDFSAEFRNDFLNDSIYYQIKNRIMRK